MHVLTVGEYTYTTDERFTARHNRATDEWVLVIKYVQERDAGVYECQIPTATSKAYPVQLNIVGEYSVSDDNRLHHHQLPSFIYVSCFFPAGNFHQGGKKSLEPVSLVAAVVAFGGAGCR